MGAGYTIRSPPHISSLSTQTFGPHFLLSFNNMPFFSSLLFEIFPVFLSVCAFPPFPPFHFSWSFLSLWRFLSFSIFFWPWPSVICFLSSLTFRHFRAAVPLWSSCNTLHFLSFIYKSSPIRFLWHLLPELKRFILQFFILEKFLINTK